MLFVIIYIYYKHNVSQGVGEKLGPETNSPTLENSDDIVGELGPQPWRIRIDK